MFISQLYFYCMKTHYLLLLALEACSGVPSISGIDSGFSTGGSTSVCNKPSWSSTVGALPKSLPNQTAPGYIVAIIADGSSTLQITYQPSLGVATTVAISAGNDSGISITGTWRQNGDITSLTSNSSSFTVDSSTFTVSGATVSGNGIWSGLNAGVGQIDGEGNTLLFSGYNANSGIQAASLTFTGICSN